MTAAQVEVLRSLGAAECLAPEWEALCLAQGAGLASRPTYGLAWWRALGKGELAVVTRRREGRLVAVAPLHRRALLGQPVLRWLGHGLGTVGRAVAVDDDARRELWDGVAGLGLPLQLVHVRPPEASTLALRRSASWTVRVEVEDRCPVLDLPEGTSARTVRSARSLKRLRNYRSALAREGRAFDVLVVDDVEGLRRYWPEIQRVAAVADAGRDRLDLCGAPYDAFSYPFLEQEAAAGRLLIVGGTVGGRWVAHEVGLRSGTTLELWLSRFDPDLEKAGPGHLVMEQIVDRAADLGVTRLDFGLGENAYKAQWAREGYDVASLLAVPVPGRPGLVRTRLQAANRLADVVRSARRRGRAGTAW